MRPLAQRFNIRYRAGLWAAEAGDVETAPSDDASVKEGAAANRRRWVSFEGAPSRRPFAGEKLAIASICERFIAEVLNARLRHDGPSSELGLPVQPVKIVGRWHGKTYRFIRRFHLPDHPQARQFDAPFARLDYVERNCFHLYFRRPNAAWCRLRASIELAEALRLSEELAFLPSRPRAPAWVSASSADQTSCSIGGAT